MDLIRLVLPGMRARRAGRIINVSSVGGMMAMPTMSIYSASKFALEGATESLYYEVKPWNIKVSLVEPGFVNSEGFSHTKFTTLSASSVELEDEAYHQHYVSMAPFVERWMKRARATPDKIAKKIIKTITRRWPPLRVAGNDRRPCVHPDSAVCATTSLPLRPLPLASRREELGQTVCPKGRCAAPKAHWL